MWLQYWAAVLDPKWDPIKYNVCCPLLQLQIETLARWAEVTGGKSLHIKWLSRRMVVTHLYLTMALTTSTCTKSTKKDGTYANFVKRHLKLWVLYLTVLSRQIGLIFISIRILYLYSRCAVFSLHLTDQHLKNAFENSQWPEELLMWLVWDVLPYERLPGSSQPPSHWYRQ